MHRKTRFPRIPVGYIVGFATLVTMTVSLLFLLFATTAPAAATVNPAMFQPGLTAVTHMHVKH